MKKNQHIDALHKIIDKAAELEITTGYSMQSIINIAEKALYKPTTPMEQR